MKTMLAVMLLASTCSTVTGPEGGTTLSLRHGQTVGNVQFTDVKEDSRCPINAQCAWQGNAAIVLRVSGQEVTLNTAGGSNFPRSATVGGITIELVDVDPDPTTEKQLDESDYEIELRISR